MFGPQDALLVMANVERTVLINVLEHVVVPALEDVKIRVRADAKAGVLVAAISVPQDVLNRVLMAAMENVKESAVWTVHIIVAVAVEMVVVVVVVAIVIVRLTIMIKKISPDSLRVRAFLFLFKLQEGFKERGFSRSKF